MMKSSTFNTYAALVAFALYTAAAWYGTGYYHPDEHYQLIEFAGLKTGANSAHELAWEYQEEIRPALQPYICLAIFTLLKWMHITDPYILAFSLRLITALLAVCIIRRFLLALLPSFSQPAFRVLALLSYFLWFMPYLNTRFSSEIWSGLAVLLAVSLVLSEAPLKRWHYFTAGLLLGIAFYCRFQTAFMSTGMLAWLFFVKRADKWSWPWTGTGIFMALVAGCLADILFYGHPVFTFLNYFDINIVEGAAARFGTTPWYYYFYYIVTSALEPLGILILAALCIMLTLSYRNIFIWIVIPFFFAHMLIAHKEGRFLFPAMYYVPVLLVQAYGLARGYLQRYHMLKYLFFPLMVSAVLYNAAALVAIPFKPAANGRKAITLYVHEQYGSGCISLLHTFRSNPYTPWPALKENFYTEKCLTTTDVRMQNNLYDSVPALFVCKQSEHPSAILPGTTWYELKKGIPSWISFMQRYYHGPDLEEGLVLYGRQTK